MTFINKFVNAFIVCGVLMGFVYWITSAMISYERRITILEMKNEQLIIESRIPESPKRLNGPSKYDA